MNSTLKKISFALAVLLALAAVPFAAGAEPKAVPVLSHGVEVLAAQTDVAVSAMLGNDVTLSADDFARGLNLSEVKYLTFKTVPPETDGELLLGSTRISAGQSIAAANLPSVAFHPAGEDVLRSSFTFTVNGGTVPMTCSLRYMTAPNYSPSVSVATGLTLDRVTYRGVPLHGTLAAADPEGDEMRFEIVSAPANGSVTLTDAAKGTYVYRPMKGYAGSDAFSYVARDPYGNYSAAATVSLRVEVAGTAVDYVDVSEEQLVSAIAVTSAGVMSGSQIGNRAYFQPEAPVSRADFLVMAMNAVGITDVPDCAHTGYADDGEIRPTMKGYVAAGRRLGLAEEIPEGETVNFRPNEAITRAEAAVMLEKLLEAKPNAASVPTFADVSEIPAWAEDAVLTLGSLGILTATNGNFAPNAPLDRAGTADLLAAAMRYKSK